MHFFRADLNLYHPAVSGEDGGVQRAIAVWLWESDVVFDTARQWAPDAVDEPEHEVTVGHRRYRNADGEDIVDFLHVHLVFLEFSVQAVQTFDAVCRLYVFVSFFREFFFQ